MSHRALFYRYKGNCCGHCNKTIEEMMSRWGTFKRMVELNHIDPSKKAKNYKDLIERKILSTEVLDEVDKCVLLCVECHKALTAQNATGRVSLNVTFRGRTMTQVMRGQFILDGQLKRISFFSDERPLYYPYSVQLGSKRPQWQFGEYIRKHFDKW